MEKEKENDDKVKRTTVNAQPEEKEKIKRGAEKLGITQEQYLSRALILAEQVTEEESPSAEEGLGAIKERAVTAGAIKRALPTGKGFDLNTYIQLMAMQNLGLIQKQPEKSYIQDLKDILDIQAYLTPKTTDFEQYLKYESEIKKIQEMGKSPMSDLTQVAVAQAINNLMNPQTIGMIGGMLGKKGLPAPAEAGQPAGAGVGQPPATTTDTKSQILSAPIGNLLKTILAVKEPSEISKLFDGFGLSITEQEAQILTDLIARNKEKYGV